MVVIFSILLIVSACFHSDASTHAEGNKESSLSDEQLFHHVAITLKRISEGIIFGVVEDAFFAIRLEDINAGKDDSDNVHRARKQKGIKSCIEDLVVDEAGAAAHNHGRQHSVGDRVESVNHLPVRVYLLGVVRRHGIATVVIH